MYPLKEQYEGPILAFIEKVKAHENLKVEVNVMSTQVFGDYDEIMDMLKTELKAVFEQHRSLFVLKIAGTDLSA